MISALVMGYYSSVLDTIGAIAYISGVTIVLVWSTRELMIGREVVNAPTEQYEARISLDDERSAQLAMEILQFVGDRDSPIGVPRNSIIKHMKSKGYPAGSAKMTIDKLLVRGELFSVRLG
ncbi:MAG: hypothetical protein RTU92_10285, partial [Candidatus Thorarchaeota archaeon]